MNRWDVYLADVPFEDVSQSKVRPVLILDENVIEVFCLKMTSHSPREGEYVLQNWESAGLKKETTVRISKLLRLEKTRLRKRLGTLSIIDIANIQNLIEH